MSDGTEKIFKLADFMRRQGYTHAAETAVDLVRLNSEIRIIEATLIGNDVSLAHVGRLKEILAEIEDRVALRVDDEDHINSALFNAKHEATKAFEDIQARTSAAAVHPINSSEVRAKVWEMTGGKCAYCGCDLSQGDHDSRGTSFSVEHVVPRQHGGPDNLANYVPACSSCNSSKSTDHVLTFISKHIERRINRRVELRVVNGDSEAAE